VINMALHPKSHLSNKGNPRIRLQKAPRSCKSIIGHITCRLFIKYTPRRGKRKRVSISDDSEPESPSSPQPR
jgi:hypothetical protein